MPLLHYGLSLWKPFLLEVALGHGVYHSKKYTWPLISRHLSTTHPASRVLSVKGEADCTRSLAFSSPASALALHLVFSRSQYHLLANPGLNPCSSFQSAQLQSAGHCSPLASVGSSTRCSCWFHCLWLKCYQHVKTKAL